MGGMVIILVVLVYIAIMYEIINVIKSKIGFMYNCCDKSEIDIFL